ncbi:MAG: DUF3301 domain-containing protein [Burkholderiales bacterium]|jgi:hypothetical protein
MSEWLILIAMAVGGWLVFDALRARETATREARDACRARGLQFLDDTVQGARTHFARDAEGLLRLRRTFSFEFSDDGVTRRAGHVVLLGSRLESLHLDPYRLS